MPLKKPASILVAPLDWGLGHATRCIPIIRELLRRGVRVIIASSGSQRALLEMEFPGLEYLDIPGYEIRLQSGFLLQWGLILRIPSVLRQIRRENQWLSALMGKMEIQGVISDNRYGLYHENLPSVFITHQLYVQSGLGFLKRTGEWIDRKIMNWNYRFIKKFSICWVPDYEFDFGVAGKLSHPPQLPPVPVRYIGTLSRFQMLEKGIIKNPLLVLVSGPEPQRTVFEENIFRQLVSYPRSAIVVRGLPGAEISIPFISSEVRIYNHLPAKDLHRLMTDSETIITRGGYSTIMDLVQLKKSAILIPTPGQTEQEYLGHFLHEKKWMYCVEEKNFNLEKDLSVFQTAKFELPAMPDSSLSAAVKEFLDGISAGNSNHFKR
jgi:UDP:flavonoid glycosyltransferase YjiC (YdhE family)